jgi:ComF family protein
MKVIKMRNTIKFDTIISVPLHRQRELNRGYNQSRLISGALSRKLGLPDNSKLLQRVRNTQSQSLLAREERSLNLVDAFAVVDTSGVKGKNILLVDDIMTTGYTLNECAKALKAAGARTVVGAVVASGRKDMI